MAESLEARRAASESSCFSIVWAPSMTKGGKRMFSSITDIFNLIWDHPMEQALHNNLIKRFGREHFHKLVVN